MKTQTILGVILTDASEKSVLEYLFKTLLKRDKKAYLVTPNPEMLVYAAKHSSFKDILNHAAIALPDGIGIKIAGKILGKPVNNRITGIDFMQQVCKESVREAVSIGLIGGKPGVAEKTADCLQKMYPEINIVLATEEWPDRNAESGERRAESKTLSSMPLALSNKIDILFVAFGHPKQEEWISMNLERLPVKVAMGVGGAFDYISGEVPRAPKVLRQLGLEWFFRLIRQPWRVQRIINTALLQFLLLVFRERIRTK